MVRTIVQIRPTIDTGTHHPGLMSQSRPARLIDRVPVRRLVEIAVATGLLCCPSTSHAQTVEVAPFVGYRFGGDLFERIAGQPVALDGTRTVGGVVNVKLRNDGLFAEALFTHQGAR